MPMNKSNQQKSGQSSKRGFAAISKDKIRKIAKKGGEHSHGGTRSSAERAPE